MTAHHSLDEQDRLRAAFQELHGPRLHGFALLLSGGDRAAAARAASGALGEAAARLADLTHPERAAAWLRARVVQQLRGRRGGRTTTTAEQVLALGELGIDPELAASLTGLGSAERAALIATDVEGLDARDVATIVGRSPSAAARLARRARRRLLDEASDRKRPAAGAGPLRRRVETAAARAGIGIPGGP